MRGGDVLRVPARCGRGCCAGASDRSRAILRREALALVGLAAASLAWKAAFVWSRLARDRSCDSPWLHSLPAYLDQFALGMGLAVLTAWRAPSARVVPALGHRGRRGRVLGRQRADRDRLQAVRAVHALAVPGPPPALRGGRDRRSSPPRSARIPAAAWSAARCRTARSRFLGAISYGIYLWHVTVLQALEAHRRARRADWHPFLLAAALDAA